MESFGEPHKRVVLWNPGYAKTRQGWEQLLQMASMAVTLVLALFAESQTSGVHQNEAMGVVFVTSVSMIFTFFVFLVSLFNLPNTLVIIGTRKEAYLSYTERKIPFCLALIILGNLFATSNYGIRPTVISSYINFLLFLLHARVLPDTFWENHSTEVMMRPGGRQRSKVPGDDSDGENSDSSGWNHEPQFRVTLNSATRNPETVVRTLSASSEECNSFAVVGDIEENPNAQKANNA